MENILPIINFNALSSEEQDAYLQRVFDVVMNEDDNSDSVSDDDNENPLDLSAVIASDNEEGEEAAADEGEEAAADEGEEAAADEGEEASVLPESDEDTGSEFELDDAEVSVCNEKFVAADGTEWSSKPNPFHQTSRQNIRNDRSGPHKSTQLMTMQETFKCFMTIEMADIIIRNTNKKARAEYTKYNERNPSTPITWKELTLQEFYSFLGILIMTGVNHSNKDCIRDLWNVRGYALYRATMPINRFASLLRFIRFDSANTRAERLRTNKAAAISEIWLMMNDNLGKYYKPGDYLTIDEQLFPYRGRTRFTQYIPSKPAKYGIKIWWVCDAKNAFPLNGQLYTGKAETGREIRQGERVVKDLAKPYRNSGRNITMDNFFTTLPLAMNMLSEGITIVGTLRKNKPYIPSEMKANKTRPVGSVIFGFREKATLCSFVSHKNKAVALLSTMHHDATVHGDGKPEIIEFYNQTKGGVDLMDKFLGEYSTQRQTRRWPLSLFFNMIDLTTFAAYKIYSMNNPSVRKNPSQRKKFMTKLAEDLCMPLIEQRAINRKITNHFNIKNAIEFYLGRPITTLYEAPMTSAAARPNKVGTCYVCNTLEHKIRRKTRKECDTCHKAMCLQHSFTKTICIHCNNL